MKKFPNTNSFSKHLNLGNQYYKRKNYQIALKHYLIAVKLNPKSTIANNNLASTLNSLGRLQEAVVYFKKSSSLSTSFEPALANLGIILTRLKHYKQAKKNLNRSLRLNPSNYESLFYLANIYQKENKIIKSISYYNKSLKINPNFKDGYVNLATAYAQAQNYKLAFVNFEKVLKINPHFSGALAHYIFQKKHACDWKNLISLSSKLDKLVSLEIQANLKTGEEPMMNVIRKEDTRINFKTASSWSKELSKNYTNNFNFTPKKKKRVVLGYVSDGFRDFPTAYNLSGVLENHDRRKFQINLYSHGENDKSQIRKRIEKASDKFVDIKNLSNIKAAERVHEDKIDILIDLKGYTKGNRLEIFAQRPSPIQISWLGFPGTTGADFIDYIIADKIVIPSTHKKFYKEKVLYLPDCYRPIDDKAAISKEIITRKNFKIREGSFVFCCFNAVYKIEPDIFFIWMNILKKIPNSVLWLISNNKTAIENIRKQAKIKGIGPKRVIFGKWIPKDKHLLRLGLADLALDTHPVNGHTTTIDALIAGVPMITLLGKHFASRVSASSLHAAGLPSLIAKNIYEYKKLAISLASNPNQLLKLKQKVMSNKKFYPLYDTKSFTRKLENALTKVHEYNSYV